MKQFEVRIGAKKVGSPSAQQFTVFVKANKISEDITITVVSVSKWHAQKKGLTAAKAKWLEKSNWYGHYADVK
jgi:hypothetical protein